MFIVAAEACESTGLPPTQFILDSDNPFDPGNSGVRWGLDQNLTRCFSKGPITIGPLAVTPAEAAVCLAQLQAHCPAS